MPRNKKLSPKTSIDFYKKKICIQFACDKLDMKAVKFGDQNKKKDNKKNKRSRYFKML